MYTKISTCPQDTTGQACVMYILKETTVHRKETNCQCVLEKLLAQIEYYDTNVVMLHNKVNILLRDT